jgi:uncharacterized protein (DUF924 family)
VTSSTALDPELLLAFWFAEATRDPAAATARMPFWFEPDPRVDAEARRFAPVTQAAAEERLAAWERAPRSCLALVIALDRFGRFPHRNAVLGRASTVEELAHLAAAGDTFGQG